MTHPVLEAAASIDTALKSVVDVNPVFMTTDEKATALRDFTRLAAQLDAVRLSILVEATDIAETSAARDQADWLAAETKLRPEDARADLKLGVALDRRWQLVSRALREGRLSRAQAYAIAHALDQLPDDIDAEVLARAEVTLVDHAAKFGPRQLARLGRRIVEVVAPEIAEEAEAKRLAELEANAQRKTRLSMRRQGDGTTRISGLLPDAMATRLATYVEAFTNPRHGDPEAGDNDTTQPDRAGLAADAVARLGAQSRRLGEGFCQFLEAIDSARLPIHGGDATTVMVTISLDDLRKQLGTAEIIGSSHLPGDDAPPLITAHEARRLACQAAIIPIVLGANSEILDLGRSRRLFSAAQHRAMVLRDRTCRAEGCDIAGDWCEAHHWDPWSTGGKTDLDDGVLLCSRHHHCVHDDRYRAERLANGDVRFHRQT